MKWWLLLICWLAFIAPTASAGDSVVYSVTTREPNFSLPISKTEIFAMDLETGKARLVFSDDANAGFLLLPGGDVKGGIVVAGGRIFSEGIELVHNAAGGYAFGGAQAVYELSTDDSGKKRKIFGIDPEDSNFRNLFVNPTASRIGNTDYIAGKYYLFIRETATGKLVRKTELTSDSAKRSGWGFGSSVEEIGWMPDDKQIFFTIELTGDSDEAVWTTPNSPVGTYVMNEDAATAARLAPEFALHPKVAGQQPLGEKPANIIGVLPDGRYLAWDLLMPGREGARLRLYSLDLATREYKLFPMSAGGHLGSFHLSGSKLMWISTQKQYEKQPRFTWTTTKELWSLNLGSGDQRKLLSFTTKDDGPPWINLIGWFQEQ